MNEHDLAVALEDRADHVTPGPAPVDLMTRAAGRTRVRRTTLGAVATAAAVALVAVGVAQALPDGADDRGRDSVVQPASDGSPPAGFRYVGLGSAVIAVPEDWPRNEVLCNATPTATTYVVGVFGGELCAMGSSFPADSDAIEVRPLDQVDTTSWTPTEVDGVEALRSPTEATEPDATFGNVATTSASIAIPSQGAVFTVVTSLDPAHVDDLLAGVAVLDGQVGIPGFVDLQTYDDTSDAMDQAYLKRLREMGLEAVVVDQVDRRRYEPGTVVSVSPEPGAVVPAGSTVTVTVSR